VLLDRLLDRAALELLPFGVCDVRRGVRIEFAPSAEAHLYCVLRGKGALRTELGFAAEVAASSVAIVPSGAAHLFEPTGGSARVISLRTVHTSVRLPTVIAGDGAPGLLVICARLRAAGESLAAFDGLFAPLVLDLGDSPSAAGTFAALLSEQEEHRPGQRRMSELLMYQCLVHLLRERPNLWSAGEPDAARMRTTAVGLKAPRSAP
jgi:hypothetical protein